MIEHSAYNHMDDLAMRIADALPEGTSFADVITACAGLIGFALSEISDDAEERELVLRSTVTFIKRVCDKKVRNEQFKCGRH